MIRKITILFISAFFILAYYSCNNNAPHKDSEGGSLSKTYCASCHAYPEPALLPKEIWGNNVLPAMAAFADLYKDKEGNYHPMPAQYQNMRDPNIENVRANIPVDTFNKIVQYYIITAPENLNVTKAEILETPGLFSLQTAKKRTASFTPCIYFDEQARLLFQSSLTDSAVNIYNTQLRLQTSFTSCKGVVDIKPLGEVKGGNRYLVTHIGSLQPNAGSKNGFVEEITFGKKKILNRKKLCDSLYRPVQSLVADFDKDGKDDIVVCEFGFMSGQLSLFKNTGNNSYKKSILSSIVGAEKMYIEDINGDGLPDLWVLFAHDIEGIYQFINKGDGKFEQKQILSFPPSYGSTYFQLFDMDGDGKKEIIYTCGDNADYSPVLKPYHGVYIFKDTGNGYKQVFFQHLNGCYKAMPADFNHDGKMDLAAISFFADYENNPKEGFVILQNEGAYKFRAYTDPGIVNTGRWISMDVKDMDNDGKPEIVLGNMAARPGNNKELMMKWMNGPEFVVLKLK